MGKPKLLIQRRAVLSDRLIQRDRVFTALAFAILIFSPSVFSATLSASLDRDTITLGEQATLSLTFSAATPQTIPAPDVDGLQIDYVGQSSHVNIVQNQISS